MRLLLSYLSKNKPTPGITDNTNNSCSAQVNSSSACLSESPLCAVNLRISEDIERRLQEDLSRGLTIHDPELCGSAVEEPLSSPCSISSSSDRRFNARSNFPVRRLDTSDIVSYLVEQRQQAPNIRRSKVELDIENPDDASDQKRPALRRILILSSYSVGLAVFCLLLIMYFTLQHFAQAAMAGAHMDWQNFQLDQFKNDSVRLTTTGALNVTNLDGLLKSATYDIVIADAQERLSRVTLPDITIGSMQTQFHLQQTINFTSSRASFDFFTGLGNVSMPFALRGIALLQWKRLMTVLRVSSLPIHLPSLWDDIHVSQVNRFTLSTLPNSDMILFRTNLSIENQGAFSFSLGSSSLQLSLSGIPLLVVETPSLGLLATSNQWTLEGGIPITSCRNCTTAHSMFLSSLISQQALTAELSILDSLIDGAAVSYLSALTRHFSKQVSFHNAEPVTGAFLAVTDTVLWRFSDTHTSLALSVLAKVLIPYGIEQNLTGLTIDTISVVSNKEQVLATLPSSFDMQTAPFSRVVDASDGSRAYDTKGAIVLDTIDRPAMANAMVMQGSGLEHSRMHIFGTYTAHIETLVGLVKVENLHFNGTIYIRDPVNRTQIVDYQ